MLWPRPHVRGLPFDLQRREGWDLVGTRSYFMPATVTYFFRNVWAWMEGYQGNWENFAWLYHKKSGGGGNKQLTSTVFDDFAPYSVTRQHFKVANNEQMPGKKQKPAYEQYLWFKYNKRHRNFVEKYDLSLKENKTKTNAKDRQQRQG